MKAALLAVLAKIGARDLFVFAGLGLLTLGAGLVYLPAAPIVAGAALLSIGIFGIPQWR